MLKWPFWKTKPYSKKAIELVTVTAGATEISLAHNNSQDKTLHTTLTEGEAAMIIFEPKNRSSLGRIAVTHFSSEQLKNRKKMYDYAGALNIANQVLSEYFAGGSDVQLTFVVHAKASDEFKKFIAQFINGLIDFAHLAHNNPFAIEQLTSDKVKLDPQKIPCEECSQFSSTPSKPFSSEPGLVYQCC